MNFQYSFSSCMAHQRIQALAIKCKCLFLYVTGHRLTFCHPLNLSNRSVDWFRPGPKMQPWAATYPPTRSVSVSEKPALLHPKQYNRCIVPLSGYYERRHVGHEKLCCTTLINHDIFDLNVIGILLICQDQQLYNIKGLSVKLNI